MNAVTAQSARASASGAPARPVAASTIADAVQAAAVDVLYTQLPPGLGASMATSVALVMLLQGHAHPAALAAWLAATVLVATTRIGLWHVRRRQAQPHPRRWCQLAVAGSMVSGTLWGLAPLILPTAGDPLATTLCVLWAAGMTAGAVGTFSAVLAAWLAFALPALLPTAVLLAGSDDPLRNALAIGAALFLAFMSLVAVSTNRLIRRGLRLRLENEQLAARLAEDRRRAEELNELLRQDLLERERAAAHLRAAKQQADALAERLRAQSQRDGLTGIANRRHFDETLAREWSRARREGTALALVLCDLDHFKAWNDACGHQAGDECLRGVARILAGLCRRGGDLAARYGGEEFALLLPGLTADEAARLAERARAEIEATSQQTCKEDEPLVTASFGVAAMTPDAGLRPGLLIEAADRALYRAKDGGRNRVERLPSLLPARGQPGSDGDRRRA